MWIKMSIWATLYRTLKSFYKTNKTWCEIHIWIIINISHTWAATNARRTFVAVHYALSVANITCFGCPIIFDGIVVCSSYHFHLWFFLYKETRSIFIKKRICSLLALSGSNLKECSKSIVNNLPCRMTNGFIIMEACGLNVYLFQ